MPCYHMSNMSRSFCTMLSRCRVRFLVTCSIIVILLSPAPSAALVTGNPNICASPSSEDGDRAVECGATNDDRPSKCCPGFVCREGRSVRCVELQDRDQDDDDDENNENMDASFTINQAEEEGENIDKSFAITQNEDQAPKKFKPVINNGKGKAIPHFHYISENKVQAMPDDWTKGYKGDTLRCGGRLDGSVECGHDNLGKPARCCPGYQCKFNSTECEAVDDELQPLPLYAPEIQSRPLLISERIMVTSSTFASAGENKALDIEVPPEAEAGDFMIIFIGGSAGSYKRPEAPKGWNLISSEGKTDINLMVLYRWRKKNDDDEISIKGGRNTFAIMSSIKGVDKDRPIVDASTMRESSPGKDGRAVAPSVFGVEGGAIIAAVSYDDPQTAQPLTRGYKTLATSDTPTDDGMAAFAGPSLKDGYSDFVVVAGAPQFGKGDDVTTSISLRPDANGKVFDLSSTYERNKAGRNLRRVMK